MGTKVPLPGLNIRRSRGKWYVSQRAGGPSFVKGFVGSNRQLLAHLATPEVMDLYQETRVRPLKTRKAYPEGTLGELADWYRSGECPRWERLAKATKADYERVLAWLEPEFRQPLEWIDEGYVYEAQLKAAKEKWPRFADVMVSVLSAMFREAVKRRRMKSNPARGSERLHVTNRNANREWTAAEFEIAIKAAPPHIAAPMMVARYLGYRGQTIAVLNWSNYEKDEIFGRIMRVTAGKNDESYWLPCDTRLVTFLDAMARHSTRVCVSSDNRPWKNEQTMQGAVSRFLRKLETDGLTAPGLTLHGLRVTFASSIKRKTGGSDKDVATALGDRSERMGGHYTRHVEKEATITRLFAPKGGE